nr:MAG TPA: hypothetical protein [Caudoviricetes sp.]
MWLASVKKQVVEFSCWHSNVSGRTEQVFDYVWSSHSVGELLN